MFVFKQCTRAQVVGEVSVPMFEGGGSRNECSISISRGGKVGEVIRSTINYFRFRGGGDVS